jgi:hypothetical protein
MKRSEVNMVGQRSRTFRSQISSTLAINIERCSLFLTIWRAALVLKLRKFTGSSAIAIETSRGIRIGAVSFGKPVMTAFARANPRILNALAALSLVCFTGILPATNVLVWTTAFQISPDEDFSCDLASVLVLPSDEMVILNLRLEQMKWIFTASVASASP